MKLNYTIAISWLAIIHPLTALAQRGNRRGGGNRKDRPAWANPPVFRPTPVVPIPLSSVLIDTQTQATAVVNTQDSDETTQLQDPTTSTRSGGGGQTTAAAPPINTDGGTTGGSGQCGGAVSGNMNVQISGDSVTYRFEPPVPGNPTTGIIGDCEVWSFPPGWGGRVHIGGGSGAPDGGTLYEGNVAAAGGSGAMDVSYVEGYSVPMICTDNSNGFVSGCGIELFDLNSCPTGGSAGGVCRNPQGPGGTRDSKNKWCEACSPPHAFFAPCAAAAYTFPTDDDAADGISGLNITCVVGASRNTPKRAGSTAATGNPNPGYCQVCPGSVTARRSLEDVVFGRGVQPQVARSPTILPRAHKTSLSLGDISGKRSHRHRIAHGSKAR
ncbi:MAG: hypothetical protein Q9209_000783 [Squamulea sp. 1 TL-2023]